MSLNDNSGTSRSSSSRRSAAPRSRRTTRRSRQTSAPVQTGSTRSVIRSAESSSASSYYRSNRARRKKGSSPALLAGIAAVLLVSIACILLVRHLKKGPETPPESTQAASTVASQSEAYTQNGVIDLRGLFGEKAEKAFPAADSKEQPKGMELSDGMLCVTGLTESELKNKLGLAYEWKLAIENPEAEVGLKVVPTADAAETTEAATVGDAENPDKLEETLETREEITVEKRISIPDLVAERIDALCEEVSENEAAYRKELIREADEALKASKSAGESKVRDRLYTYKPVLEKSGLDYYITYAGSMWYREPKGASIGSYDREQGKFLLENAEEGYEVDREKLREDLENAVDAGDFTRTVTITGNTLKAEESDGADQYKIIATYTTKTTSNSVRNKNISLACQKLNGTIVRPGEEFSFNGAVGQRTREAGYGEAAAYSNGEVIQEVGGGVCQVSTTLYNAVVIAGLKTTYRQSHTFQPSYVTPGQDATVSWGGPDYRFANLPFNESQANAQNYAIGILAEYHDRTVTVSIYGRPVLKSGYTYALDSQKTGSRAMVRILLTPELVAQGKKPSSGSEGSDWVTYLIVKKDGEQISKNVDHHAYYTGHTEYYEETTPTVPTSEEETPAALPSTEAAIVEGIHGGPGVTQTRAPETQPATTASQGPVSSQTPSPGSSSSSGGPGSTGADSPGSAPSPGSGTSSAPSPGGSGSSGSPTPDGPGSSGSSPVVSQGPGSGSGSGTVSQGPGSVSSAPGQAGPVISQGPGM